ncbi:MAG: glycosyltransferase family 2 protein [Candidatus Binatia bacterium]
MPDSIFLTKRQPLVSIGVPVYNGETFLRAGLDALLAQTYPHLEVVIADNASTDHTEEICREYANKDARVRYHRNPRNVGVYANFRHVLALARGDYFMWAAVDDLRPLTAVEDCLTVLLADPQAVMAHGLILVEPTERPQLFPILNEMELSADDASTRIRIFTEKVTHNAILYGLYRRHALLQGWLGSCYGQDYLLCLQMCLLGRVVYTRAPMMICRERQLLPSSHPMYAPVPLTVRNLLRAGGLPRRKCWVVLFMGCYYLVRIRRVSLRQRLRAVTTHVVTFGTLHRTRLLKEVLFQLLAPIAVVTGWVWHLAQQQSLSLRLARRVQGILTR